VKARKLDHIAIYMRDRASAADFLTSYLGFHVVDHTERYTLVGAGGRLGKLTLFDAPEGTEPGTGEIERITLRVTDVPSAVKRLPDEAMAEGNGSGKALFTGPEGLSLALVHDGTAADYDLEGITLRSDDPEGAAEAFVAMGFEPTEDATSVAAGEYRLRLVEGASDGGGMLFHLGCLVDSAEEHRKEAESRGMKVQNFVEGPNTLAVFVLGPGNVSVEYVEHKPGFSLE
jgi:catechol 2,3-dioxygenase-like lactoylglutathione lyase family enzyme